MPCTSSYRPDPAILELGGAFYDPVQPADFPQAITRFRNDRWASEVGLADLSPEEWTRHFGRFEPLPDNLPQPLALRYHGHQFRVYNPQIGDGRGFLFAQVRDGADRLLDLGTKGSGQTPYSRFGDGRLTLKGGVREILATEMLEALGVQTSRTFSLIETASRWSATTSPPRPDRPSSSGCSTVTSGSARSSGSPISKMRTGSRSSPTIACATTIRTWSGAREAVAGCWRR
jgi:uncharacterized protein YdiU (UPF0061 family)